MSEKKYSERLRTFMEEYKALVAKHDVAAIVILHEPPKEDSPGYAEYFVNLEPSYSAVKMEDGNVNIRINRILYPSAQQANKVSEDTSNMLVLLAETAGNITYNIARVSEALDQQLGAVHTDSSHTPKDIN